MINNNEEIRNFSKSNSLSMSLPEKFSPELIRPLKKSNLSKTHHNEKNDKREKGMCTKYINTIN